MTEAVQMAARLSRSAADKIDGAASTYARRLIEVARLTDDRLTPDAMLEARRSVRALAPGTAWPTGTAAQVVVGAFARLTASASVLRRTADVVAELDARGAPGAARLADKTQRTALAMLAHVSAISQIFSRIEGAASGLRDVEASDIVRAGGWLLVLLGATTAGAAAVPGAVVLGLAEIIDHIDGTGSEAAQLAREACTEMQRTTGRPCTPEEWAAFYQSNRAGEREDSFDRAVKDAFKDIMSAAASAGFWLLLLGGLGTALYFAWPFITSRATSSLKGLEEDCGCGA